METRVIIVLGMDEKFISEDGREEMRLLFGPNVLFLRKDPGNPKEHLAECERLNPAAVLVPNVALPRKASPRLAIEKGFIHVSLDHKGHARRRYAEEFE